MENTQSTPKCTCPPDCTDVWDADPDCPIHGPDVRAEQESQQAAEIWAENGWLRAAEAGYDDGFEQWEAERGLI